MEVKKGDRGTQPAAVLHIPRTHQSLPSAPALTLPLIALACVGLILSLTSCLPLQLRLQVTLSFGLIM